MKKQIKNFAKKLNIEFVGFTEIDGKSVIVCLFPYFSGYNESSNISVYTYATDYHKIIKEYLNKIVNFIKEHKSDFSYDTYVDISPYNDRNLAYDAGLGIIGENGLLINEKYGSYVFIGYIVSNNIKFESDSPILSSCLKCGVCINKCPTNCLKDKDFKNCLSEITQKKGDLTQDEIKLIIDNNSAFGCDICQKFCPMNKENITPIKEFKENLLFKLKKSDFVGLSNKEFYRRYGERAFSWRGKNTLIRNLTYIEDNPDNQQE